MSSQAEPVTGIITHRGIVNTPECDENGHMNVQFYWARFALADRQFRMMEGLEDPEIAPRISRHVRYHSELHGAFGLSIASRFVTDAAGDICILHEMIDDDGGIVSATALDRLSLSRDMETAIRGRMPIDDAPAHAPPRSLALPAPDFARSQADLADRGAILTCRTVVEPHLCGIDGTLTDRGFVAMSVEAAPASWAHAGFGVGALLRQGHGRVALEKRLTINCRPHVGDLVQVLTRIVAVERVTFSMRHAYFDSRSGAFLATCDVTVLAMDLTLRKAVPLPAEIRTRLQVLVAG